MVSDREREGVDNELFNVLIGLVYREILEIRAVEDAYRVILYE